MSYLREMSEIKDQMALTHRIIIIATMICLLVVLWSKPVSDFRSLAGG